MLGFLSPCRDNTQIRHPARSLREGPPVAGISERAVFVVDKAGKIAFAKVYPIDQLPEIEELLGALRNLP